MKRLFLTVMLALFLAPAAAGAVSLAALVDPEPASPPAPAPGATAPTPSAQAGGRLEQAAENPDEPRQSSLGWFIGPMLWKVELDFSALDPMTVDRGVSELEDSPLLPGIMGGIILDNWRVGGLFVYGSQRVWDNVPYVISRKPPPGAEPLDYDRRWCGARVSLWAIGAFVDYDREIKTAMAKKYSSRIPYLRYGWLVGGIAAYGRLGLEADGQDMKTGKWTLDQGIIILNPYAGLWISPFDWIWAQIEIGYVLMLMDDSAYDTNFVSYVKDTTSPTGGEWKTLKRPILDGAIDGGPQIGLKIVFGSNPNFKVKIPPPR